MAATTNKQQPPMACPDPSAHEHHHGKRLQEQSATAALYVTHPERATSTGTRSSSINPLGPDGKLSSAGAAASLKYARAEDLPSFPSVGIDTKNSGLTAATLAAKNPKDIQWWKPGMSADASKAALLANDYKMQPLWQPDGTSAAGSKAALLAHQGKGRDWWQPEASKDGLQAATLATKKGKLGPEIDYGYTEDGRSKALLAATLSVKGRKRAESTPAPVGSEGLPNSLKAATMAHRDGMADKANEMSRITHARHLSKDMYTSHPDLDYDKQEKAHQDALKGASISMAKKMYAVQKVDDQGHLQLNAGQAARTADRSSVSSPNDIRQQALQYLTLQDAAQRLAAERLAKIENQQENAALYNYYGYGGKRRSRLTLKGRNRRRASSEGAKFTRRNESTVESEPSSPEQPHRRGNLDIDSDDEEQAQRVRARQNNFNAKLAEADKKRQTDKEMLLAAAQRRVEAQMSAMDKKVFDETGKMSPAMIEEWDNRARQKAAAASQMRMQNHGKVDIGGGKYLDQSEIDAIARRNVQPTLDEIDATAEKQRARDEEIRLEKEEQRRVTLREKERNAETKALAKKMKDEDKEAERTRKRDEKIAAKYEKNAAKEERRQGKETAQEERERAKATAQAQQTAMARRSEEHEATSPSKDKKSPWKKLLPGHRHKDEREPGRISSTSDGATTEPRSSTIAAGSSERDVESRDLKPESEEASTGANMAGDTPSTVAAPVALPETQASVDAQVVTPVEERIGPIGTETTRDDTTTTTAAPVTGPAVTAKSTEDESNTPASPSKKRFSRILGKLKRNKKDEPSTEKRDSNDSGFAGGAKLHKERKEDGAAGPSSSTAARSRSPSVSSLSSSDILSSDEEEEPEERRGRSREPSLRTASNPAMRTEGMHFIPLTEEKSRKSEDSDNEEDDFEEARDGFNAGELAPPPNLLSRKTESPVRDSKFTEVL